MSDNLKPLDTHNVLFPALTASNLSHEFMVTSEAVQLMGNFPTNQYIVVLEKGIIIPCGDVIWIPFRPCGSYRVLSQDNNVEVLELTGTYRAVILRADFTPLDVSDDITGITVVQFASPLSKTGCCCE